MTTKVPCPAVVKESNKNMGGVDLLDSLITLYQNKIKWKKWYWRVYLWEPERVWRQWHEKDKQSFIPSSHISLKCRKVERIWSARKVVPVPQLLVNMRRRGEKTRCSNSSHLCAPGCHSTLDDNGWKEGAMQSTMVHSYTKSWKCDVHLCFT